MPAERIGSSGRGPASPATGGWAIRRRMMAMPAPKTTKYVTANTASEVATPDSAIGEMLSMVRSWP